MLYRIVGLVLAISIGIDLPPASLPAGCGQRKPRRRHEHEHVASQEIGGQAGQTIIVAATPTSLIVSLRRIRRPLRERLFSPCVSATQDHQQKRCNKAWMVGQALGQARPSRHLIPSSSKHPVAILIGSRHPNSDQIILSTNSFLIVHIVPRNRALVALLSRWVDVSSSTGLTSHSR
jgi:hypothetical protein